jgi:imidazolonepropionase-like amidohydrolase
VIDVRKGRALEGHTVLIEGDKIKALGPDSEIKPPPGALVIPLGGRSVIPGLVDGHIHLFQSGGLYTRPDAVDLRHRRPYAEEVKRVRAGMGDLFRRYLASGVTTVVDEGGPMWNFDVREEAERSAAAPRVLVAGPLIASYEPAALAAEDRPIRRVASVTEALALLRQQLARRPDHVKVWYVASPALVKQGLALSPEAFFPIVKAVAEETHRAGLTLHVHATELATAKLALRAGADVLVHSVVDEDLDAELLELARGRRAIYVPTLHVFGSYADTYLGRMRPTRAEHLLGNPEIIGSLLGMVRIRPEEHSERVRQVLKSPPPPGPPPKALTNLAKAARAGLTVAAGTDAGNIGVLHGPGIFRDLHLMAKAGMSPAEVLRAATLGGALLARREARQGAVEPGLLADLVVLEGDPLVDLSSVERPHLVVKGGKVLRPEDLLDPSPEALAQRQLNAYNSRDLEAFVSVFHPEVEVRDFPSGLLRLKGREAFANAYRSLFASAPSLYCHLLSRMVQGRMVIDQEEVTGIPGRPLVHATAIYETEGRLIRRVWFL